MRSDVQLDFLAGLSISDFSSDTAALFISSGATVNLEGCTISRNTISDTYSNSGVISVNAVDTDNDNAQQQNTTLRMQQCILFGNSGVETIIADSTGIFNKFDVAIYSNVPRPVYYTKDSKHGSTLSLNQVPASRPGIAASSPWFLGVQQVWQLSSSI